MLDRDLVLVLDGCGGLIFDFDGTLADTEPYQAASYAAALTEAGVKNPPGIGFFFERCKGHTTPEIWQILLDETGFTADVNELEKIRIGVLERLLDDAGVSPFPEIIEVLDAFKNKPKAVVSSDYQYFIEKMMAKWGVLDCFDVVSGLDEGGTPKEARLLALFEQWKPAALFEDSQRWLDFARAHRAVAVAVPSAEELEADWVLDLHTLSDNGK